MAARSVSTRTRPTFATMPSHTTTRLALGSIAVGALVLSLKSIAYWLTGSVALFSDALESIVNIAAAVAAFVALRVGNIPADANHPYGHHKAEYFSSVLEGVLIVVAAMAILREAYFGLLYPKPLQIPLTGMLVNGAATLLNGAWAWVLVRNGRRFRSPALAADGRHLFTDVVSSVGVLGGVALVSVTGWNRLDALLAGLVALHILWAGWGLVRQSVGGLMDEAPSPEELARLRSLISTHAVGALEAHDLRTRHAGRRTFIEFHLVVPGEISVQEAHDICDRLEEALRSEVEESTITIHVEPEHKAKQTGVVVV